jgi:four helix bundle protein
VTQETRIKSFRDLRVWQVGMKLVEQVYVLTRAFPKHELYGLASQMQRAAVSIPSNIAEGRTREHLKEYLQHLSIARSSLAELETQLEIATRLGYCRSEQIKLDLLRPA